MLHHRLRAASGAQQNGGGGIPENGLLAHYTMENISGGTLIDETGNYDGTIYGATIGAGYLDFDGSDRVDIPTLPARPQNFSFFVDVTPDSIRTAPHESSVVHMMGGYGAVSLIFQNGAIKFYLYDGS